MSSSTFLTLHGVPVEHPISNKILFYHTHLDGWRRNKLDDLFKIESYCIDIYDLLDEAILGRANNKELHDLSTPMWVSEAGHSADSGCSADRFDNFIRNIPEDKRFDIHSRLYLSDCHKLVDGIRHLWQQIRFSLGEFYNFLNHINPTFCILDDQGNGVNLSSGHEASAVWSFAEIIYIRLHSLLDYNVKLTYEVQNLQSNFQKYPKMSSKNKQYGDRRKLGLSEREIKGTLFEDDKYTFEVEAIRNQIIHNGVMDIQPRVFLRYESNQLVEKFILMPDMVDGRLIHRVNRNLFFANEDKLNLRLPNLVDTFLDRQLATFKMLIDLLLTHTD